MDLSRLIIIVIVIVIVIIVIVKKKKKKNSNNNDDNDNNNNNIDLLNECHEIKLYGKNEKQLDFSINTVPIFSQDIGIKFSIEKCGVDHETRKVYGKQNRK